MSPEWESPQRGMKTQPVGSRKILANLELAWRQLGKKPEELGRHMSLLDLWTPQEGSLVVVKDRMK